MWLTLNNEISKKLKINILYYIGYKLCSLSLFFYPIVMIYLVSQGFSFTEIMILNGFESLFTFLLEIPTGVFADSRGRKRSVFIGLLFLFISVVIYIISKNFYVLLIASFCFAVSESLISGADTALLYDMMMEENSEKVYLKVKSDIQSFYFFFNAIVVVISGFLYELNSKLPFVLSALFICLAIFFVLKVPENSSIDSKDNKMMLNKADFYALFKVDFSSRIILFVLINVVSLILISNLNYISQSFLKVNALEVHQISILLAIFNVIAGISARFTGLVYKLFKTYALLIFTFGISLVLCSFLLVKSLYFIISLLVISRIINGLIWPILSKEVNAQLSSEKRATYLSSINLIGSGGLFLIDPLLGLIIDKSSIVVGYSILGLFGIVASFIIWYCMNSYYNKLS